LNTADLKRLEQMKALLMNGQNDPYAGFSGNETALRLVLDLYQAGDLPELVSVKDLLCQHLLVCYREAKRHNPEVAGMLLNSLMTDARDAPGSRLFERMRSLLEALHVQKRLTAQILEGPASGVPSLQLIAWQAIKATLQAGNEFLNALLAFYIQVWRVRSGEVYRPDVFTSWDYSTRLQNLAKLSGGEDGFFYLLFRMADRPLRNALAHGQADWDTESGQVSFPDRDREGNRTIASRSLEECVATPLLFSHLPHAYLAGLSAVMLLEGGNSLERISLPKHLQTTFYAQV